MHIHKHAHTHKISVKKWEINTKCVYSKKHIRFDKWINVNNRRGINREYTQAQSITIDRNEKRNQTDGNNNNKNRKTNLKNKINQQ